MTPLNRRGILCIVSGPSGSGKTTLCRALSASDALCDYAVSCTTRAPRGGEVDGRDYHFLSREDFEARTARGEFLEWAEVHGNFYGTSRTWIAERLAEGADVLLEIDWQGAQQVREQFPAAIGVFVLPPSMQELTRRLTGRGTDSAEVVEHRLAAAAAEMRHAREFDYVIINDRLEQALADLCAVVHAARLTFASQRARHAELFARMI